MQKLRFLALLYVLVGLCAMSKVHDAVLITLAAAAAAATPWPRLPSAASTQCHQLQLVRQRVRMLKQQLERCVEAHSRLQGQLETEKRNGAARCARLQQQVEVEHAQNSKVCGGFTSARRPVDMCDVNHSQPRPNFEPENQYVSVSAGGGAHAEAHLEPGQFMQRHDFVIWL